MFTANINSNQNCPFGFSWLTKYKGVILTPITTLVHGKNIIIKELQVVRHYAPLINTDYSFLNGKGLLRFLRPPVFSKNLDPSVACLY